MRIQKAKKTPTDAGRRLIPTNQSVEKAFAVLQAFAGERRALNLAEIAAAAGITKSSAQRFVSTL
ncbi:helix-turn-helix domain-containing protein, partial [Staphylococcus aureus]